MSNPADDELARATLALNLVIADLRKKPEQPIATDLYRHFDSEGCLLYVGISLSAIARLAAHRVRSSWFNRIARVEIKRFPSREDAEAAELEAIRTEKPLHNIVGRAAA
jgi:hypothetical protein